MLTRFAELQAARKIGRKKGHPRHGLLYRGVHKNILAPMAREAMRQARHERWKALGLAERLAERRAAA
jgi:hypothetical protein